MPAVGLNDLPEDCYVAIKHFYDGYTIQYVNNENKSYLVNNKELGFLGFSVDETNPTKKIFAVGTAVAQKGFGPLLYSISMEFVNKITNGKGYIKSDPYGVSSDAERVWNYFDKNDPTVQKKQLDSLQNELTPTKIDNVNQSFVRAEYKSKWPNSALSRGFSKKSENLINHPKVRFIDLSQDKFIDLSKIDENIIKIIRIKNVKK